MDISTGRAPALTPGETPSLHVDAAASAALLAIETARRCIYHIAEPNAYLSTDKARRDLGFDGHGHHTPARSNPSAKLVARPASTDRRVHGVSVR
jgi:hypothetical protein